MKTCFIVANWKSNKTVLETKAWFQEFPISNFQFPISKKEIIICPSFSALSEAKSFITQSKLPFKLGAQDISPFPEGAYTGEINGKQIKEFATYVLIGHSERRKNFFEDDVMLERKVEMAHTFGLTPIFFVQDKTTVVPHGVSMVVYEPPTSISPGIPDTPENADGVASFVKEQWNPQYVFYGGNVTSENVSGFTCMPHLDGVLVGRASLDAPHFLEIVRNA